MIQNSLKFVRKGPIDNKSASFQVMAWRHHSVGCTYINIHIYFFYDIVYYKNAFAPPVGKTTNNIRSL